MWLFTLERVGFNKTIQRALYVFPDDRGPCNLETDDYLVYLEDDKKTDEVLGVEPGEYCCCLETSLFSLNLGQRMCE